MAALGLLGACFLLWWMRADVEYFWSSREPIELGAEGDYRFEAARSNRYAHVHGSPMERGWYASDQDGDFVLLVVQDAPLILRRPTVADEGPGRDGRRPPPRLNAFSASGRLLARADAGKYREAFEQMERWAGQPLRWILVGERRPGADLSVMVSFTSLCAFALFNLWLLRQGLLQRPRRGR